MKSKRTYTMGARAEAVQETRRRILQAVVGLAQERRFAEITLDATAAAAGVSVQTVLRQFGSRGELLVAATDYANAAVVEERETPPGDVRSAVRTIVDHYEQRGDAVLLMLSQEDADEHVRRITDRGKRVHREWVRAVFSPQDAAAEDLLVIACDVYTWKLLRRDRGLSRRTTERRIDQLVRAVLADRPDGRR